MRASIGGWSRTASGSSHGARRLFGPCAVAVRRMGDRPERGWDAPGNGAGGRRWSCMTLGGLIRSIPRPVCHVSTTRPTPMPAFKGKHLPTEANGRSPRRTASSMMHFGIAWQWTAAAIRPTRLSPAARRAGRIQRQVHDQPDGAAWQFAGNSKWPFSPELSQLFLPSPPLAVHRPAAH